MKLAITIQTIVESDMSAEDMDFLLQEKGYISAGDEIFGLEYGKAGIIVTEINSCG